jgi:hypothetical protein
LLEEPSDVARVGLKFLVFFVELNGGQLVSFKGRQH